MSAEWAQENFIKIQANKEQLDALSDGLNSLRSDFDSHKKDTSIHIPASRKINSKPLSGDITLRAEDVGASKVEASTTNGNIKVDGVEMKVVDFATDAEVTEMMDEVLGPSGGRSAD